MWVKLSLEPPMDVVQDVRQGRKRVFLRPCASKPSGMSTLRQRSLPDHIGLGV
jgi:hypothetical protein